MSNYFSTLQNLSDAAVSSVPIFHRLADHPSGGIQRHPLLHGTDPFTAEWLVNWHNTDHGQTERDIFCYSVADAVVSGSGQVWLGGQLVTSPEIMPPYVARDLDIKNGGNERLNSVARLPVRIIDVPCVVATGHGIRVYGHFLIEILFRILVARRAYQTSNLRYHILLSQAAPEWLLRILTEYLGVHMSDIEFFRPEAEKVLLRHAILPTLLNQNDWFHPIANDLLTELLDELRIKGLEQPTKRIFIARNRFHNASAPGRICINEAKLADIAAAVHGFTAITIEAMTWPQQIALFRDSEIIVGQAGSGLHNALFSRPGSRLASIGLMNLVQSAIGVLREQHNAFLMTNVELVGEFRVDEQMFGAFLDQVCAV